MNCIIPGPNIKVMAKAVHALSKIRDEMFIEAKPDHLAFIAVSTGKTAYTSYKFLNSFFTSLQVEENPENAGVSCKVPMKSILNIFKSKSPSHKEKKLDLCKIELDNDATKIIFKLKYKHDITVVHALNLIDYESISLNYNKDNCTNLINASGQFFAQILSNFQMHDEDMNLEVFNRKVIVRNYDTSIKTVQRTMRSQITVNATEFHQYNIGQETNVTVVLKPFRSAIQFAESFNLNICLHFERGGRPTVLVMQSPTFEVNYVIATVNSEGMTQTSVSSASTTPKRNVTATNNNRKTLEAPLNRPCNGNTSVCNVSRFDEARNDCVVNDLSLEDREALESVVWDDFDVPEGFENNKELLNKEPNPKDSKKPTNTKTGGEQSTKSSSKSNSSKPSSNSSKPSSKSSKPSSKSSKSSKKSTFNDIINSEKNRKSLDKQVTGSSKDSNSDSCGFRSDYSISTSLRNNLDYLSNRVDDFDVIPKSPESPRAKKAKIVLGRCAEATFHTTFLDLGEQYAANSDPDSDSDT